MKLKKGDKIKVIRGKDKGKEGTIEVVFTKENKVLVPEVNMYKRHLKATMQGQQAGIKEIAVPLRMSNVALVCPKCKMVTRAGYKVEDGKKTRICKKCEQAI